VKELALYDVIAILSSLPPGPVLQMAQQLRRELQQQTEREIQALQESLDREEEVAHFRHAGRAGPQTQT